MKRATAILILLLALTLLLAGCANNKNEDNGKIKIIATLFPQYDFAREVAGDKADVTLLLPPGMESHSYEPSPNDIVSISKSDIFIYTGEYMEPWAKTILNGIKSDALVVNVSKGIELHRDHGEHDHDEHGHDEFDPHIWTDPTKAIQMVKNIKDALILSDPENEGYYSLNADNYIKKLIELDQAFEQTVENARLKEICFGGRFAMRYFAERYGIDYIAAFDSCSSETEPSAKAVAEIIDRAEEKGIKVIYYEELVDSKVADSIANRIGGEAVLLHSCHNLSKNDFDNGETYLTIMYRNVEALKQGLN